MAAGHKVVQSVHYYPQVVTNPGVTPVKFQWRPDKVYYLHRTIMGTVHFGYVDNGGYYNGVADPANYVMEDGTRYLAGDWSSFSSYSSTFTLPQDFGLAAVAPSSAQVTNDQVYSQYTTDAAGLGSRINTLVQATLPTGHTAPTQFKVILDANRARVMAYLSGLNSWAPLLWVDKFGHHVSFKWTYTTSGLPAGLTGLHSLTITNTRTGQPARGVQIQWASFSSNASEQDLLRADFIGVDLPSMYVKGYPGLPTVDPIGFLPPANPYTFVTPTHAFVGQNAAGLLGRVTSIQVGASSAVALPNWMGSGQAKPIPPVVSPSSPSLPLLSWGLEYDANHASVTAITDTMGVRTVFGTTQQLFPYEDPARSLWPKVYNQSIPFWQQADMTVHSVSSATSTDCQPDPVFNVTAVLNQTWSRSAVTNGSWTVTYTNWFSSHGTAQRSTEYLFGGPLDLYSGYSQLYNNASLVQTRVLDATGTEIAKTVNTYAPNGLDSTLMYLADQVVTRSNALSYRNHQTYTDGLPTSQGLFVGATSVSGETPISSTSTTYDTQTIMRPKLSVRAVRTTSTTRTNGMGTILNPSVAGSASYTNGQVVSTTAQGTGTFDIQYYSYDTEGRRKNSSDASSFNGNHNNTLTYGTDGFPLSSVTTYYRPSNQTTGANSISQGFTFDSAGRLTSTVDATGVSTTTTYDTLGRILSQSRQGSVPTTYDYSSDLRTRTTTQGASIWKERQDGFGRTVLQVLPDGQKLIPSYDAHGRVIKQQRISKSGSAQSTTFDFDALNRMTATTSPAGVMKILTYGVSANGTSETLKTTIAGTGVRRVEYRNLLGQVISTEEPTGGTSTMEYNGAGRLSKITINDPGKSSQVRQFIYNESGQLIQEIEPETNTKLIQMWSAEVEIPWNVWEGYNTADVRATSYTYDGLRRLCKVTSSTSSDSLEYFYDGPFLKGALSGGANPVAQAYTYKAATEGSRLASETTTLAGVSRTISYNYLASGRLGTVTYPEQRRVIGYNYDGLGQITSIQDRTTLTSPKSIVSSITQDEWGQLQRITFGSGAYSDWSTQASGTHLNQWNIGYNSTLLDGTRFYQYDTIENLKVAAEWDTLKYDNAGGLITANSATFQIADSLGHDVYGNNNIQNATGAGSTALNNFGFDPFLTNQLPATATTPLGAQTYFSSNGRGETLSLRTSMGSSQMYGMTWDGLGRMSGLSLPGISNGDLPPAAQNYTYAPSGLRIQVVDTATPANNRRYAYTRGGALLAEYTDSGWKRDVVYLGSSAIAEIDSVGIHELHIDYQGTPRVITSGVVTHGTIGQIEGKQAYGPYGEFLTAQASGYRPITGYTGHLQTDPTNLIYMRGRFYSPAWHRFLNSDQGADPNSLNQMAYAWGNPMMVTDSSGMAVQTDYCVYCADRKYDNPVCFDNLVSASAALRNLQNVFHNCRIIYPGTATVVVSAPPWWVTPVGYELSIPSDQLQPLGPSPLTGSPGNLPPPQSPKPDKKPSCASKWWQATKQRFNATNSVTAKPLITFGTNVAASLFGITGSSGATGVPTLLQYANGVNGMAAAGRGASLSATGFAGLASLGQAAFVGTAGFLAFEAGVAVSSAAGGLGDVLGDIGCDD
jgi:RHS repeat-associated protein